MKKVLTLILIVALSQNFLNAQNTDSVDMNAGYAMDVYYSLENGTVQSVAGSEWTVAFSTGAQTSSIYINDGQGVDLYQTATTPANFTDVLDTAGISGWTKLYNEYNDWDHSAFEFGATGHPNYGWGEYNAVSHIVNGTKVYILKTLNNTFYKVQVVKKESGAYHYRYATLNNSFDTTIVYQASDLSNRNFAFLNMDNHIVSNREPAKETWDMLFTKYYDTEISYPVVGVLVNRDVEVIQVDGISNANASYTNGTFANNVKNIGSDWKDFDMTSFSYVLAENRTYFVKQVDGDIYKIYFTRFDGSSTGKIEFSSEKVGSSSIKDIESLNTISLYPNPANTNATLVLDAKSNADLTYTIYSMLGKQIETKNIEVSAGLNAISLNIENLNSGIYLVQVKNGSKSQTLKLKVSK